MRPFFSFAILSLLTTAAFAAPPVKMKEGDSVEAICTLENGSGLQYSENSKRWESIALVTTSNVLLEMKQNVRHPKESYNLDRYSVKVSMDQGELKTSVEEIRSGSSHGLGHCTADSIGPLWGITCKSHKDAAEMVTISLEHKKVVFYSSKPFIENHGNYDGGIAYIAVGTCIVLRGNEHLKGKHIR